MLGGARREAQRPDPSRMLSRIELSRFGNSTCTPSAMDASAMFVRASALCASACVSARDSAIRAKLTNSKLVSF